MKSGLTRLAIGTTLLVAGFLLGCVVQHARSGVWYELRDEKTFGSEDDPVVWRYVTDSVGIPFLDAGTTTLEFRGRTIYKARCIFREDVPFASNIEVAGRTISWEDGELKFHLTVEPVSAGSPDAIRANPPPTVGELNR